MGLLIAAAVVAAGAAAYGAYETNKGNQQALSAEQQAWMNVKDIDIPEQQRLVSQADIAKYKNQFAQQAAIDPNSAALRTQGVGGVLQALKDDRNPNNISTQTLAQGKALSDKGAAGEQGVIDQLIARAKSDLAAGATLPPEFQAELVRSGLSGAATNGQALNGDAGAGTQVRTLLGQAGIQLQAQRQNEAVNASEAAGQIQSRRASILQNLAVLNNDLTGARSNRALGAAGAGYSAVPDIGLSGKDVGNLSLANWKLGNTRTLAIGGIQANKAISNATANTGYASAISSGVTGALGGMGGGSGGGSWIGGLLNQGGYGSGGGGGGNPNWVGSGYNANSPYNS